MKYIDDGMKSDSVEEAEALVDLLEELGGPANWIFKNTSDGNGPDELIARAREKADAFIEPINEVLSTSE